MSDSQCSTEIVYPPAQYETLGLTHERYNSRDFYGEHAADLAELAYLRDYRRWVNEIEIPRLLANRSLDIAQDDMPAAKASDAGVESISVRHEPPRDANMETRGSIAKPYATMHAFGIQRPIDSEPWFTVFKDARRAAEYPHRCTAVTPVTLYCLARSDASAANSNPGGDGRLDR